MEYHQSEASRFFPEGKPRRVGRRLARAARFWIAVIATVAVIYAIAFGIFLMAPAAPEKPSVPVAEKLVMHRAFIIGCDATMSSRGALEKWTPPSCYVRGSK